MELGQTEEVVDVVETLADHIVKISNVNRVGMASVVNTDVAPKGIIILVSSTTNLVKPLVEQVSDVGRA